MQNQIRKRFDFVGTPVRVFYRKKKGKAALSWDPGQSDRLASEAATSGPAGVLPAPG